MLPATPRPAASLILVRDTAHGPQVLLGRRSGAALAFPGAVVFPGGKIEPGDREAEAQAGAVSRLAPAPPGAAFAALRETFEETGLWLTAEEGVVFPRDPGLGRLLAYAHWITPAGRPYRFDTWFFLAAARSAEASAPLGGDEFETLAWSAPTEVLADPAAALLPPTRHSLQRLARCTTVAAILEDARAAGPFEAGETRWDTGRAP